MKKIALLIVLLLSITNVFSQDKKAKTLLNQVTTKIKSYENIAIDFKYTLNNAKENINSNIFVTFYFSSYLIEQCFSFFILRKNVCNR